MKTMMVAGALSLALASGGQGAVRDIQIVKVDLSTAVVTLQNVGAFPQPIDGFRFCTADENEFFRYTAAGGFNGTTLGPGETLDVHWNNDAPGGAVNVASLGGFVAAPLDAGPYGLAIYWTSPFELVDSMADYMQFTDSLINPGNGTADARAGVAAGVLWTGANEWVVLEADTTMMTLNDLSGGLLHGPASYDLGGGVDPCPANCGNDDVEVTIEDLLALLANWDMPGDCDIAPNGGDGVIGIADLLELLANWGPCP